MRKSLVLIAALLLVASIPAMAARTLVEPFVHETIQVYQAYPGDSAVGGPPPPTPANQAFAGYLGLQGDVISSVPGILSIVPGMNWANFVAAAQAVPAVSYTIKNVVLHKETPQIVQCADIFPAHQVNQQGTPNIRLWWPLMYEVPSTTWTLTIIYGTPVAWADPANPGEPAYIHTEVWSWHVDANLTSMHNLLELFHELPFGLDEVPLISDEDLYIALQAKLSEIETLLPGGHFDAAGLILADFEMEVMDACITVSPMNPDPRGPSTGIAHTLENPACCKLMADAEYVGYALHIFQPKK